MTSPAALPIAVVARQTGLSAHTLRYYEKVGLVPSVSRNSGGQRRYAAADLDWLTFLLRLRTTGMSISGMQHFAQLRRGGQATAAARLTLLRDHAETVRVHIEELQASLAHVVTKVGCYEEMLSGAGQGNGS